MIYSGWTVECLRCRRPFEIYCYDTDLPTKCGCGGQYQHKPKTYQTRVTATKESTILEDIGAV